MNRPTKVTILSVNKNSTPYTLDFDSSHDSVKLYYDDSVQMIKYKIIDAIQKDSNLVELTNICYEEMYLFEVVERNFDVLEWYKMISLNHTVPITTAILLQWIRTLYTTPGSTNDRDILRLLDSYEIRSSKNNYVWKYEKLLTLPFFSQSRTILQKTPLGLRSRLNLLGKTTDIFNFDEAYCANPNDLDKSYLSNVLHQKRQIIPKDDEFLIHYGVAHEQTLYLVLARDVLKYHKELHNTPELLMKYYYPYLYETQIINKDTFYRDLDRKAQRTDDQVQRRKAYFRQPDLFYQVYHDEQNEPFPYLSQGIEEFSIGLENQNHFLQFHSTLETIFQSIHAKEHVPFLLFYKNKEEIHTRIYCDRTNEENKKIPYLNNQLITDFARKRSHREPHILFYVQHTENNNTRSDFVEVTVEENGTIRLNGATPRLMTKNEFSDWFIPWVNTLLESFRPFLHKQGYEMPKINSLYDPSIKLYNMNYVYKFNTNVSLDLLKPQCLRFLLEEDPNPKTSSGSYGGRYYRYKRVEHYQPLNPEEEIISTLLKMDNRVSYVKKKLREMWKEKSPQEIQNIWNEYSKKYTNLHGVSAKRTMRSYIHTGFPVEVIHAAFTGECTIYIRNIDNFWYLDFLKLYFESIGRLHGNISVKEELRAEWLNTGSFLQYPVDDPGFDARIEDRVLPKEDDDDEEEEEDEDANINEDDDEDEDDEADKTDLDDIIKYDSESDDESTSNSKTKAVEFENSIHDSSSSDSSKDSSEDDNQDEKANDKEKENNKEQDNKDNDDDDDFWGGAGKKGSVAKPRGVDRNSINQYFEKRIKMRYPQFEEKFSNYNKVCLTSNVFRRQPIVMTKKEKEEAEEHLKKTGRSPYAHNKILQYGEDNKGDPLYYTCPRYWCMKPGQERDMTEEEVKSGVCGKVIQNISEPASDEFVFDRGLDEFGEAKYQNPEFVNTKKGSCLPCCFVTSGKKQMENRKTCNPDVYDDKKDHNDNDNGFVDDDELLDTDEENRQYINNTSFIYSVEHKNRNIQEGRFAVIPISIQTMMKIDTQQCMNKKRVKDDCTVFFRSGIEAHPTQSFLAALAYATGTSTTNHEKPIRLAQFKKKLPEIIQLDHFVRAQNGSLAARFHPPKPKAVDIEKYTRSQLYKSLNMEQETQAHFFQSTVQAYEEFLRYLTDPTVLIDHTYLWDLISMPGVFFENGANLILIQERNDDVRNKVDIICPTSAYSNVLYEKSKANLLMFVEDNYYVPIVQYYRKYDPTGKDMVKLELHLTKLLYTKDLPEFFDQIFSIVNERCIPQSTVRKQKVKPNFHIKKYFQLLDDKIIHLVQNYQGKIIGMIVEYKQYGFYLPCFPSTVDSDISISTVWMDDVRWKPYVKTYEFLEAMSKRDNIPCKPKYAVEENKMIVGILTESNQMVLIDPPVGKEENVSIRLPLISTGNTFEADKNISLYSDDTTRSTEYETSKIELEYKKYRSFRGVFRILMSLAKNQPTVEKIHRICIHEQKTYKNKIGQVYRYLKEIGEKSVQFALIEDDAVVESLIQTMECCTDEPTQEKKKYCLVSREHDIDNIWFPKKNLVSGDDNEMMYYTRLADELIRNKRIHMFMFYPEQYMNISSYEYETSEKEILIPLRLIPSYLKSLREHRYGHYGKRVPYEQAEPNTVYPNKEIDWVQQQPKKQ